MSAIDNMSAGRTVLLLTHRLVHLGQADRIVVLSDGRIAEEGSYADLIRRNGPFRTLTGFGVKGEEP